LDHFNYETDFPQVPFTNTSTWEPKLKSVSQSVQSLIQRDINSFAKFRPKPAIKCNLSKEQLKAIKNLGRNPSIVIKPADKGSQIVIMDRVQYLLEADKHLNNTKHYATLPQLIQAQTQGMIRDIVVKLCQTDFITDKQCPIWWAQIPPDPDNCIYFLRYTKLRRIGLFPSRSHAVVLL